MPRRKTVKKKVQKKAVVRRTKKVIAKKNEGTKLERCTFLIDKNLYKEIKMASQRIDTKIYELINKFIIIGIEKWSKGQKDPSIAINTSSRKLSRAVKMAAKVPMAKQAV
jgi:hypothetical protein